MRWPGEGPRQEQFYKVHLLPASLTVHRESDGDRDCSMDVGLCLGSVG